MNKLDRRSLMQLAAGMAAGAASVPPQAKADARPLERCGKPGDFHFLSGEWRIHNRRLKAGQWDQFQGAATVTGLLDGIASVEELRIPERQFSGMGLRLLDVGQGLWADYWVNGQQGVLSAPPAWGSFRAGVGRWDSADEIDGKRAMVRGVWDQITPTSCRWSQAVSRDDGKSWEENWLMHWTRV